MERRESGFGFEWEDGWRRTGDLLVRGICHELNGRLAVLSGLLELSMMDGAFDAEASQMMREAVARMESLVSLLRVVPATEWSGSEPVRLADAVGAALTLLECMPGLEDVETALEVDGDPPPVEAEWSPLVKALVLVLHAAATEGAARLAPRIASAEDGVTLSLAMPASRVAAAVVGAAAEAVKALDGEIAADGATVVVTLPVAVEALR